MINIVSQNKIFLNWLVIYPQNRSEMEEFIPLEAMMTSRDVTGWPAIVRQIVNKIDFDTVIKCREVSTAFKHFLDNNRNVWIDILDRVRHEYLDLLEVPEPIRRYVSPEEVKNDHKSWMVVLEKIKNNGTIEDIIFFGRLMKQSKNLILFEWGFCPIKCLFSFFDNGDWLMFGFELAALSMKVFQTFLRLGLEEEDELISRHFDDMIQMINRSQNPEVVEYFMTKLMRFDSIKTRDEIKIFDEDIEYIEYIEYKIRLEERAREVEESNLALLAEMPFFMI